MSGNSGMWILADSMFFSFTFSFWVSSVPIYRLSESTQASLILFFFPSFLFCASVLKAECPHCAICCIKFLQRSIWGHSPSSGEGVGFKPHHLFLKRLEETNDNDIQTTKNWSSPWGNPCMGFARSSLDCDVCPEETLDISLAPLATLGESLPLLPFLPPPLLQLTRGWYFWKQ